MNFTYLVRCSDGSLYCGWTNRLEERVRAHNEGRGAKYTKSRRPVELVYCETHATKEEALRREAAIKKMTKREKEKLVQKGKTEVSHAPGMQIIISPAKKMRECRDVFAWNRLPAFLDRTEELLSILKGFTPAQLKELFKSNEKITQENFLRYRDMDLRKGLTPAALAYVGIQYQYMAPQILTGKAWEYLCAHLWILSGFYGILRADDGIVPYRLEMQAKLATDAGRDLYAYWGPLLYQTLSAPEGACILNLASKEYSRAIEPWLGKKDRFVTCVFGTLCDGTIKVKATEAKMARGEMVRFLAEKGAENAEAAKEFDRLGFSFDALRSDDTSFVFLK